MNMRAVIAPFVTLGFLLPGTPLPAQLGGLVGPNLRTNSYIGFGYVASVPITPVGFSVLAITPKLLRGAGLYADFKRTTKSPGSDPYFLPNVSVQDAEVLYADLPFQQQSDWVTIDLAMVYAVTGEFAVYGGAGYSKETHYRQFEDTHVPPSRGDLGGFYWVADPAQSGTRINVLGGGLARIRSFLYFQMGVESAPWAANLGFTVMLAR